MRKTIFCGSVFIVLIIRCLYIFSFPLNFGGDASVYYTMILEKKSSLLMAAGYPFLMMIPYHFLRSIVSKFLTIPSDPKFSPWWETSTLRNDLIGSFNEQSINWIALFQNHDFLIFQHLISVLALFCGFRLVKKYFGFNIAILFLFLYGINPLSLEWPSSSLPEWLQSSFLIFWLYFADLSLTAKFLKKLYFYALLGVISTLGFLIKYNSIPVYVVLFIGLLYLEREKFWKTGCKFLVSIFSVGATIALFLFSYHYPLTGSKSLNMNTWTLFIKTFQFIPEKTLPPEIGINAKKLTALLNELSKTGLNPIIDSPAYYFQHLNHCDSERTAKGYWLLNATNRELDSYLGRNDYVALSDPTVALRVAYYTGLKEYSTLLKGIYLESIKAYPLDFFIDTAEHFLHSFSLKEKSYYFQPHYNEIQIGRGPNRENEFGFVKFKWNKDRFVCYHENAVWMPGAWFFSKCFSLWPPVWFFCLFSFIAFFIACKQMNAGYKDTSSKIVIFSFLLFIMFVWFSNMILSFRLKEFEFVRFFPTLLTCVGLFQVKHILQMTIKKNLFVLKCYQKLGLKPLY